MLRCACFMRMSPLSSVNTEAARLLILPLDRTSHGRRLLPRAAAGLGYLLHCFKQVAPRVRNEGGARGIEPAAILQLVPGIEAEEVRRALSAVGFCHLLRLVDDVGEAEIIFRSKGPHIVK